MMQKIQKFGAAMFTPVLLFAFAGIMVGLATLFKNEQIIGSIAHPDGMWFKIWWLIEQGAWTIFNHLPLVFVIGLPIGLAKKQSARACLEALVIYLTFNYFLNAILTLWGPSFGVDFTLDPGGVSGLTTIAGIKTLDMGMMGAILIAAVVVFIHDRFFDTELPEFLGIFKGSTFVYIIGFMAMIPIALLAALIWPKVQTVILSLQTFMADAGPAGVGIYAFLNRILIPTGLHHFVYSPFLYDNVAVQGGIVSHWAMNLGEYAASAQPLISLFPQGGFALYGNEKIFGSIGIALAFYATARPEKKKVTAGLLIPVTLTAVVAGVTEPLEFTFLFVAPVLFVIHSLLSGLLDTTLYLFGVVGNFGGGLIEFAALNWIPLGASHGIVYIKQFLIGGVFTGIYFLVFRTLILKFNFITPGREADDEDTKLYTRADYNEKTAKKGVDGHREKAAAFLTALGGPGNITEVTNCATRLRVSVRDESILKGESAFKKAGAHGVVVNGKAVQVIVGMSVPNVREEFEAYLSGKYSLAAEAAIASEPPDSISVSVQGKDVVIKGVATGEVISLQEINDEAFASGIMGGGIGIKASPGEIYAPFDATVQVLFPTKHAIGLVSDEGVEMLIHIGIDTVKLGGEGFKAHVIQGDAVKKGQLLVTFDTAAIKQAGYDATVAVLFTGENAYEDIEVLTNQINPASDMVRLKNYKGAE